MTDLMSTSMFCFESTLSKLQVIWNGSIEIIEYPWITGHTKALPP
jgi:hypothetical protein